MYVYKHGQEDANLNSNYPLGKEGAPQAADKTLTSPSSQKSFNSVFCLRDHQNESHHAAHGYLTSVTTKI